MPALRPVPDPLPVGLHAQYRLIRRALGFGSNPSAKSVFNRYSAAVAFPDTAHLRNSITRPPLSPSSNPPERLYAPAQVSSDHPTVLNPETQARRRNAERSDKQLSLKTVPVSSRRPKPIPATTRAALVQPDQELLSSRKSSAVRLTRH